LCDPGSDAVYSIITETRFEPFRLYRHTPLSCSILLYTETVHLTTNKCSLGVWLKCAPFTCNVRSAKDYFIISTRDGSMFGSTECFHRINDHIAKYYYHKFTLKTSSQFCEAITILLHVVFPDSRLDRFSIFNTKYDLLVVNTVSLSELIICRRLVRLIEPKEQRS